MQFSKPVSVLLGAALMMAAGTFAWAAAEGEDSDGGGAAAMVEGGGYREAPVLAAMVAAGELPPVEDRLPVEPKVLAPLEEVGTYGGTLEVFASGEHPWVDAGDSPERSQYPLRMNFDGSIEPDQAKGYELSDDLMTFTMFLREGMKWSNGDDFTAEDFRFKREMDLDEGISTWGYPEQLESITAVDDYTVRYDFRVPYPRVVLNMLHWRGSDWRAYAPSAWLKQWHIEYNPNADAKAKEEGFDNWAAAFNDHYTFCCPAKDINKPTLHPWKWEEQTTTVRIWERNPYYYAVDTAMQQLPYIDRVVSENVNLATYKLRVIAGEADYAQGMGLTDYPLLKQNEASGNFTATLVEGMAGADVAYTFGVAHLDPVKRELFNNVDFNRAMSLAIDRDTINETVWLGQAVPRQATARNDVRFYKPEWGEAHPYARYDPDEANRILDSIGLDKRNADGVRLMANGEPLNLVLTFGTPGDGESGGANPQVLTHELVKEHWAAVGVNVQLSPLDGDSIRAAETEGTMDIRATSTSGIEFYDFVSGNSSLMGAGHRGAGRYYAYWSAENNARSAGIQSTDATELPGEKPPADFQRLYDMARVEMQSTVYGSPEYMDVRARIYDLHAEKLWTIGVVGQAPAPIVARNNLVNVPRELPAWAEGMLSFNYYANMFFFKN